MNDYLGTFIQYAQELQDMKTQAISTNEVIGNVRVRFVSYFILYKHADGK